MFPIPGASEDEMSEISRRAHEHDRKPALMRSQFLFALQGRGGWTARETPYFVHCDSVVNHPNHALARSRFGMDTARIATDWNGSGSLAGEFCWELHRDGSSAGVALVPGPAATELPSARQRHTAMTKGGELVRVKWQHDAVGVWWLVDILGFSDEMPVLGMGPNTRELAGPAGDSGGRPARIFRVEYYPEAEDGNLRQRLELSPGKFMGWSTRFYVWTPTLEVLTAATKRKFRKPKRVRGGDYKVWFAAPRNL